MHHQGRQYRAVVPRHSRANDVPITRDRAHRHRVHGLGREHARDGLRRLLLELALQQRLGELVVQHRLDRQTLYAGERSIDSKVSHGESNATRGSAYFAVYSTSSRQRRARSRAPPVARAIGPRASQREPRATKQEREMHRP